MKKLLLWCPVNYLNFGDMLVRRVMIKELDEMLKEWVITPSCSLSDIPDADVILIGGGSLIGHPFLDYEFMDAIKDKPVFIYADIAYPDFLKSTENKARARQILTMSRKTWLRFPESVEFAESHKLQGDIKAGGDPIAMLDFTQYGNYEKKNNSVVTWNHYLQYNDDITSEFILKTFSLPQPIQFLACEPQDSAIWAYLKGNGVDASFDFDIYHMPNYISYILGAKDFLSARFHCSLLRFLNGKSAIVCTQPNDYKKKFLCSYFNVPYSLLPNIKMETSMPDEKKIQEFRGMTSQTFKEIKIALDAFITLEVAPEVVPVVENTINSL